MIVLPSPSTAPKAEFVPSGNVDGGIVRDPVMPAPGTAVAVIVPEPLAAREAPVPTNIAAALFVPDARSAKVG